MAIVRERDLPANGTDIDLVASCDDLDTRAGYEPFVLVEEVEDSLTAYR